MPIVPYYQEDQRTGSAPDGRFSINGRALDLASGRQAWGAVQQAGAALQQTGQQIGNIALQEQREHNQAVALERLTEFEKRAQAVQEVQSQRLRQNALTSGDGKSVGVKDTLTAELEKMRAELTADMNDAQKRLFESPYQNKALALTGWAGNFEGAQRKAWQDSVDQGYMAQKIKEALADPTKPAAFMRARADIETVMRLKGQREGWDENFTKSKTDEYLTKYVYAPALDMMIEGGNLPQARGFLKQFGADLGGEATTRYESQIEKAMTQRMEQGFLENINNGNLAGAAASLEVMKHGDAAGFAAQYESGAQGSNAIGYDRNGGTSYGKFQISSKAGTFDDWLRWLDKNGHQAIAEDLRAAGAADTGSRNGKTPEVWRALVESGAITDDMQLQFIKESHLEPALEKLPQDARDAILADPTLYRAFFSTAVQHGAGGATNLLTRNWNKAGGDKEAFLDSLYEDRKTQFASSTGEVQASASDRFDRERASIGAAMVSQDKIRAYQNMLQDAAKEKQKTDREAVVLGAYSTLNEQIRNLSPEQQDAVFYSGISKIEDAEVRNKLRTMREKDRELIDKKQTSLDATLVEDFEKQMGEQNVPYAVQLEAAASLKKNGMSHKAYDNLVARINKGLDTVTKENEASVDSLYGLIDTAILGGQQFVAEDISRYAVAHNLTPKQKEDARKYFDEGGKEGFLWKSRTKIGEMYAYYTGKELKDNPQLFESVRKGLEGKTATERALRETVASIVIGGTEGESVSDKWSLGYGQNMTWNEAKKAGDAIAASWLPDVNGDDAKRIREEARYMYGVKKSLTEQNVRWIRRRELGIPTPADRLPKEYANAGK